MNGENDFENLNKRFFGRWAEFYDAAIIKRFYFEPLYQKIIFLLKSEGADFLSSASRILDAACGTGEIIYRLAKEFSTPSFVGVDFSAAMVEKAKKKNAALGHAQFQEANVSELPFADNYFDIVFCSEAFHHFLRPDKALQEFNRVLKPGGLFLLVDPAFNNRLWKLIGETFLKPLEHAYKYYSKEKLGEMLERHGFANISVSTKHFNNFLMGRRN